MDTARSLMDGRYGEALAGVRAARRSSPASRVALNEASALLGLGRFPEAVDVATRALARGPQDLDVKARLRLARAEALWHTGRREGGREEAEKALDVGRGLTRARGLELIGFMDWKSGSLDSAWSNVDEAQSFYASLDHAPGVFRVLGLAAGLLHDEGRLEEALAHHDRRLALAWQLGRRDLSATARVGRGAAYSALGHWCASRQDLEAAAEILERTRPWDLPEVDLLLARLSLAGGQLAAARANLRRAEVAQSTAADLSLTTEVLLTRSDLQLAAGSPEEAEVAAGEALQRLQGVGDKDGECRSRLRRSLALVCLGRTEDAALEARRARKLVSPSRRGLAGLAALVEGRALLKLARPGAVPALEEAQRLAEVPYGHLARLGLALARGAARTSEEVRGPLGSLEAWGDQRLLAYALADLDARLGPQAGGEIRTRVEDAVRCDPRARAVTAAAARILGTGPAPERWAQAMRCLHPVLPWWRVALVGGPNLELRWDLDQPIALPVADLAREVAALAERPLAVDLTVGVLRSHPTRVLHRLRSAVAAPVGEGCVLYADFREGAEPPLGLVEEVAALVRELAFPVLSPLPKDEGPRFDGFLGRCPEMERVFRDIATFAGSDVPVHIVGETGTGKERVAAALHQASKRARGPFIAVNAPSLGDELGESHLFGYVRGAFTGAQNDHDGYVAEARGGTLFLDEITELPPRAQARLLRFFETGEYRRLGENRLRQADVRIVTASNVSLEDQVATGRLRHDLMYRLQRLKLQLPPLRARGDDIVLLALHFLGDMARREGRPIPTLPAQTRRLLVSYPWPGNVRELRSEMERLLLVSRGGPLGPELLSEVLRGREASRATVARLGLSLKQIKARAERDHIAGVLEWSGGNRSKAACALGLSRQALVTKISRLGIG